MTLQKGQSVHYAFTQDTKAEAFYHGFAVAVNKTDGTSLSVIRCDNWENIDNSKSIFTNTFPEGWGSDMASFQSTVLAGATADKDYYIQCGWYYFYGINHIKWRQ